MAGSTSIETGRVAADETPPSRGVFFLVVGPSGVGKDALIEEMRARRPDILFPQRVITRAVDAGGEAHAAVSPAEFDAMEADGLFALSWRAHGLAYGVPVEAATALSGGRSVLVNASRGVIAIAREVYPPIRVLSVTAPAEVLAQRLAQRGRETPDDIAERLARAAYKSPMGDDVATIDNGGALASAVAAMADAIAAAIGDGPRSGGASRAIETGGEA